jgi:ABC-type multidrug transport system fused ATPase/permease subunit
MISEHMLPQESFLKRTLLIFKPFWKPFGIVFAFMLVGQIIGTFSPYLFGKSVDAVTRQDVRSTILLLILAFVLSYLQQHILVRIREKIEVKKLDRHIEQAFSLLSLQKMFSFSVGQHINEHSGVKQGIVNKGQRALEHLMYNFIYNILPASLQVIATLGVLAFFDWRIALTAAAFVASYIILALQSNHQYFPKIDDLRKKDQALGKLQSELFRNSTLVIAEGKEKDSTGMFSSQGGEVVDFSDNVWTPYISSYYNRKNLLTIGQWASLGLGVYLIFSGYHSIGMFVALFSWTSSIFGNIGMIMNSQRQILFQIVEIKKFYQLLDIAPDMETDKRGITIPDFKGKIEFNNVSFAYPYRSAEQDTDELSGIEKKTEAYAVEGVSFTIPAGGKIGFVGVSGSGKSTIVNLIRRYYDATEGNILIDDKPLKEIDLHWLRSQIGNVEQKIELFDRSIKDNIVFGLPNAEDATEEQIKKAVDDASLGEFIDKLTDHGLNTVIGEGGIKVSGGERQRIGIARALIKNPKILIFDEATSALDSINEKLIHDAINRGSKGRTTIIIAHRLSTVMDADIIFVVEGGKIVDRGTHAELLESSDTYMKLIANQILAA